ncbi:GEVED domain-containing protein, partial [Acinetobacter baumannii]
MVPTSATLGTTRMRVAKHYNSYQTPCNAGTSGQYGEAEDYTLTIVAPVNCSGTPPATTAYGPSIFCQDSLITVSISV